MRCVCVRCVCLRCVQAVCVHSACIFQAHKSLNWKMPTQPLAANRTALSEL